jgi:hypothetical protein
MPHSETIIDYLKQTIETKYQSMDNYTVLQKLHEAYCLGREALVLHELYLHIGGKPEDISPNVEKTRFKLGLLESGLKLAPTIKSTLSPREKAIVSGKKIPDS